MLSANLIESKAKIMMTKCLKFNSFLARTWKSTFKDTFYCVQIDYFHILRSSDQKFTVLKVIEHLKPMLMTVGVAIVWV